MFVEAWLGCTFLFRWSAPPRRSHQRPRKCGSDQPTGVLVSWALVARPTRRDARDVLRKARIHQSTILFLTRLVQFLLLLCGKTTHVITWVVESVFPTFFVPSLDCDVRCRPRAERRATKSRVLFKPAVKMQKDGRRQCWMNQKSNSLLVFEQCIWETHQRVFCRCKAGDDHLHSCQQRAHWNRVFKSKLVVSK